MNRLFAAITACALATIPLSHANAFEYSYRTGKWDIYGQSLGTTDFTCTTGKRDESFFLFLKIRHFTVGRDYVDARLGVKSKLPKDAPVKITFEFKDGKTFSFFGRIINGMAVMRMLNSIESVDNFRKEISNEKPVSVTVDTPDVVSEETTNIDLKGAQEAMIKMQTCMDELMDHAGVLP